MPTSLTTKSKTSTGIRENKISEVRKDLLYLEAYSRRENLKFEGITEWPPQQEGVNWKEDTKVPLIDFFENVLGIKDAKNIVPVRVS